MDLFTYLMAKNDHNTSVNKDLFSYLLGKNQSGTYTDYSGTSLSINNTKKGKMKLSLKGNTSQTGTPTPDNPIPINVVSGDNTIKVVGKNLFDDSAISSNPNVTKNSDGFYTGTIGTIRAYFNNNFKNYAYKENTQYTITYTCYSSASNVNARFVVHFTDGTTQNWNISNNQTPTDIIYRSTSGKTINYIDMTYGNDGTIYIKNIMMVEGNYDFNTMPPYEPYQSSTYPVNLPVENLASLETTGSSIGGVSFTKENGVIHINGTTNSSSNFYFNSFRTKSGTATYWVEVTGYTDKESGNCSIILQQSTDNSTWSILSDISLKSTATHQASVTLDSSKYYRIRWYTENNTFTNATIKIQLEYGNKKNSFTPYGTTPIELCKISTYQDKFIKTTGKNLVPEAFNERLGITGTGQNRTVVSTNKYSSLIVKVKPNTSYTIGGDFTSLADNIMRIATFSEIPVVGSVSVSHITGSQTITLTTPNNVNYLMLYNASILNDSFVSNLFVSETSVSTTYEPYGNGDWYKEEKIKKYTFTGNENWDVVGYGTNSWVSGLINVNYDPTKVQVMSNIFKGIPANDRDNILAYQMYSTNTNNVVIRNTNLTTKAEVQSATSGKLLYYALATPTYTKIEGTLKDELEAVWRANTFDGQTNISQENNDLPFELDVSVKIKV